MTSPFIYQHTPCYSQLISRSGLCRRTSMRPSWGPEKRVCSRKKLNSLLEEYTSSDDSSSSDETDSCGSDDLTLGEVNFAECSENESDNVQFAKGCSARGVFAWEDMENNVGQRENFLDNCGPQNEAQNETHCAKVFKMFLDVVVVDST